MNKSAILHIPMSQYAFGLDEKTVVIRLRTAAGDLQCCNLYYGDRACRKTPVEFTKIEMRRLYTTEDFDFYEAIIENCYKRLCYYFELIDEKESLLFYGDQFEHETVDDRSEYFQLPFNHRADIVSVPEWAKHAVFYNIFPDSFATGKRFISGKSTEKAWNGEITRGLLGGTIKGITENIDYIKGLGANAIYINPIFVAGEYHKYDLLDYYHIDPCLGTNEDFAELVAKCHNEGIRVVIDGVFNHCGWRFFAFDDVVRNGEKSRYRDWFYGLKFPVIRPDDPEAYPNYECFGYERLMPKLNMENPETKEYFCNVGKYWIENFHIDGWRLDVASEINDEFWREFRNTVKKANPEVLLIGEIWESANHWLDGTMFDSSMNYDFRRHCKRFFAEEKDDAARFNERVVNMLTRYRSQTIKVQLNVLDSHDVSRFLSVCGESIENYKLALLFQMTFPGMPMLFYGDECGLTGIIEKDYRRPMQWNKKMLLTDYIKTLISLRISHEALQVGNFEVVAAKQNSRVYKYRRCLKKENILVVINMDNNMVSLNSSEMNGTVLLSEKLLDGKIGGKGFAVISE